MATRTTNRAGHLCNGDAARVANALATIFLIQGTPVIFYGTEQGFAQEFNRHSLWHTGYNTARRSTS